MTSLLPPKHINSIFETFSRLNPKPETELQYKNTYTLLVAVALSAQATDISVNKATKTLFAEVDTPEKMLDLGLESLLTHIKTIGLHKTKAKHIMATAKRLVEVYNSQIPQTREDLETLPGVGRKTANVVLNVAFGHSTLAVDTHIFRVSNRLGLVCAKTPLQAELQLEKVIPALYRFHAHHWLILHGRYICKARTPLCGNCPVYEWCLYEKKTNITLISPK